MKTRKILTLVACAVLLVAISVVGTLAFLNDTSDTVINTFTVGDIKIALDEVEVDTKGEPTGTGDTRVTENEYKLIPGNEYTKDPTVHVTKDSEICWVFITVKNEISGIELQNDVEHPTIAEQIEANGWTIYDKDKGIYYMENVDPSTAEKDTLDLPVFANFTIDSSVTNDVLADYAGKTVVINAYAIQSDNLETAAEAWDALNPAPAEEPAPETH